MRQMERRLAELERSTGGPNAVNAWHQIIQHEGETLREAVEAYGKDKIGSDDGLIIRAIVSPNRDANGSIISPPRSPVGLDHSRAWRAECGL